MEAILPGPACIFSTLVRQQDCSAFGLGSYGSAQIGARLFASELCAVDQTVDESKKIGVTAESAS